MRIKKKPVTCTAYQNLVDLLFSRMSDDAILEESSFIHSSLNLIRGQDIILCDKDTIVILRHSSIAAGTRVSEAYTCAVG